MGHHLTTCTFCGVGCGLYLATEGNRVTGVYPSMSHPTNAGRICLRGWHVHEVASSPDRLRHPLIRRKGGLVEASWEEALGFIAERLESIRGRHGADALAFFCSPRCSNEEAYLLQKLARVGVGTNNVDHGTGVYTHNSIHVLCEMLGVPATTNSVAELARSDVILVDGVDLGMQLPTIGGWVMRARLAGAKLIVLDARRHRLAEHADFFLQARPGTDTLVYGAMAKVLVDRGWMNLPFVKQHCRAFEPFLASVQAYDLLQVAEASGVAPELIEGAAQAYGRAKAASVLYSTGSEARSEESIQALVNLALLAGQLGREGAGIYALTEHNNLQGVGDMGMSPDRLPGHFKVGDERARGRVERVWGRRVPAEPGRGARECFEAGGGKRLRGVWLCRYDPVATATFCDAAALLREMELVVVQHLFHTETAEHADVVLPTVAFGEEEVTFTSTDRRIQLARRVIDPPPGPMPAWQQMMWVGRALGLDWVYPTSAAVMREIAEVVPTYSGVTHENLGRDYGRQWPCTKDKPLGTQQLFEDGLPAGRFHFVPVPRPPAPSAPSMDYPLALIFGHSLYYWNQNVLVKHSETLRRELRVLLLDYPEGFVEINDQDAQARGIRDGSRIRLVSERGQAETVARVTREVRVGTVCAPFFVREVERQIWGPGRLGLGTLSDPVFVRVEKA